MKKEEFIIQALSLCELIDNIGFWTSVQINQKDGSITIYVHNDFTDEKGCVNRDIVISIYSTFDDRFVSEHSHHLPISKALPTLSQFIEQHKQVA